MSFNEIENLKKIYEKIPDSVMEMFIHYSK